MTARTPYSLTLTQDDYDAVSLMGYRYGWSSALYPMEVGENVLTEGEAHVIRDAIESDDAFCPCLSPESNLYAELNRLLSEIV